MKKIKSIVALMVASAILGVFAADSAPFPLNTAKGTRIAKKRELISYSTEWDKGTSVRVTDDGATLKEAVAPASGDVVWDCAKASLGLHTLTHVSGDKTLTAQFIIPSDDVAVHSGKVSGRWDTNKVHLIVGAVTVPKYTKLTINPGAIVKFMPGSALSMEDMAQLTANGVIFTHVNDDTVGGDTLMDNNSTKPKFGEYTLSIGGLVSIDDTTEFRYAPPKTLTSNISSDTRLGGYGIYIVSNSVTVASEAKLTLRPGTVLKFNTGCSLIVNGALEAEGTRTAPIVFTSLKDDEYGGDTNGDGDKTYAQGGDWYQIRVSGMADFNYCHVLYNSSTENYGGIEAYGGTINFDNSEIAHTKYECVNAHSSGNFTARNSVLRDSSLGFGYYGSGRVKAYNCVFSDLSTAVRQSGKTLVNCVFYRCLAFTDQSGDGSSFSNCVFFNDSGYGAQSYTKCGSNGNIWGNPKFVDAENGDFRISADSPCVDAGDGSVAPETDYYGQPRMDIKNVKDIGVANKEGVCPDIGIYEVPGDGDVSSADLEVISVIAPKTLKSGEKVVVEWRVFNKGQEPANGVWRDEIELVAANGQVFSMGSVTTKADIKSGASANFKATVTVPSAPEGAVEVRVIANKYKDLFESLKVSNNVGVTTSILSVSSLTIPSDGEEFVLSLASGTDKGFALSVPDGAAAVLVIRGAGELDAWLGNGSISSKDTAIRSAVKVADDVWLLEIPAGTDARVTLSNGGLENADIGLSLEVGAFFIFDTGLTAAIANGVSLTFTGNGFDESIVCEVVQNGNVLATATDVIVSDSVQATAVFNLASLAAGNYTLRVTKGKDSAYANLLLAYSKTGSKWNCDVEMPESIRAGRVYVGALVYSNDGAAPMPAPYVCLNSKGSTLIRLSEADAWTDSIEILACSEVFPASVLKPGERRRIPFYFKTSDTSASVNLAYTGSSSDNFPWDNIDDMRPSDLNDEIWGHVVSVLKARFGKTWNDYLDRLRDDCDMMLKNGQSNIRVDRVWQLEMNTALGNDYAVKTLASSTDLVRNGRGLSLAFARVYQSSLKSRMKNTVLGYGWDHNYSAYAVLEDVKTLVFHLPSGLDSSFTKVSGSWSPQDSRDKTVLTETSESYILTFSNGTVHEFAKSNMRTSSIRDNQGNKLIFTYSGENLAKVSHSDGQYLSFSYSSGKLVSVRDDQGRTVSYAYDGDLLVSATAYNGLITKYSYDSLNVVLKPFITKIIFCGVVFPFESTKIGDCDSLCEITYPDGSTRKFEYDESARVSSISVNGMQKTEIDRDSLVSYSIKAPNGAVTKVVCAPSGEVLKSINALGETVSQVYTADSLLESVIAPSGKRNKITYNKDGQPISSVSASGTTTGFAYTDKFANLASVSDAKGHSIGYSYDELGRGIGVSFVDGSSSKFEYNERGDVVRSINRRGETIEYEYDSEGNLTKKLWSNGRTFTISYDAKGNITNAADSVTGAVMMEYDANERLTRIVHPKGRGFAFKYDSVGRMIERASFDGAKECFSYDSFGRVKKVTDGAGNAYLINTYDSATSWLVTQEYGNGTVVSNAYDILGRTVGIYHLKGKNRIAFFEYAYDVDGKCISQITAEGKESYTYDADGQLTSVTYPDGTSETFTYDAVGNRISRTGGSPVQNETYSVNNLNQYTEIVNVQAARSTMEYDLDGNMTRKGDTRYWYDTLNRLIAVTNEAENIRWSCEYDVFGNRVSVTDNGTTTERLFVQGSLPSVAAEYQGNTLTKSHVLVGAVRIAEISRTGGSSVQDSTTRYYHGDMLGSARLLTDGTGATKGTRSFKAFGEMRTFTGETTDAGYVGTLGVETDSNGLLFMRNRYYDASVGRFVQMDPIGLAGGDVDLYRYVDNTPMDTIDPNGWYGLKEIGEYWSSVGSDLLTGFQAGLGFWPTVFGHPEISAGFDALFIGKEYLSAGFSDKNVEWDTIVDSVTLFNSARNPGKIYKNKISKKSIKKLLKQEIPETFKNYLAEKLITKTADLMFPVPKEEQKTTTSDVVISCDPNEMAGPLGKGEKRYVEQGEWMNYTIYFENKTNATAAAQEVFVDLPMDPNLDWSTLELGEIVFGEHIDTSLSGKSHGKASYAMPGTNTFVKTTVTMKDGVLSWYLRDWDPTTVDNFPASATGGFLPPNNPDTHCGEGHLSYRVRVKADAPAGAVIRASAQIVFDSNPMIETDPSWWNTVGTVIDVDCGDGLKIPGLVVGMPYGKLPVPAPKEGYEFGGWFTGPDGTGEQITEKSIVKVGVKLYGYWIPVRPLIAGKEVTGNVPDNAASTYDGYLYDEATDAVVGIIQAKLSKPKVNKKLGVATTKTSVAIQITGEKKITLKGELDISIGEFIATDKKSGRVLILKFGSKGISGTFGKYDIDGARNFFDSKDKSEKSTAEEILKPYLGAYSMILDGGILSVTIAKKGKVTVKGAIDGNKVSAKAQALIGEDMICIPVIYSKKSVNLAFTIWLPINGGDAVIIGFDDAIIGKAGTLKNGAKFVIDGDIGASIETEDPRTLELLPDNETITVSKSKWLVADGIKPAKVAYKKGEFTITEGKKGAGIVNPSGLKLSYKSKDGSFTGSFTAYAIVKGKLKKHKATVEGILIGDVGYGTITIKKVGTWGVRIE